MARTLSPVAVQFLRFAVVGVVGFLVDAGILMLLTRGFGMNAYGARLISFSAAVFVTFECNRRWAFQTAGGRGHYASQFLAYLSVQGTGFLVNMACYVALLNLLPVPFNHALLCLAVASAIALMINFTGARVLVFRAKRTGRSAATLQAGPRA